MSILLLQQMVHRFPKPGDDWQQNSNTEAESDTKFNIVEYEQLTCCLMISTNQTTCTVLASAAELDQTKRDSLIVVYVMRRRKSSSVTIARALRKNWDERC